MILAHCTINNMFCFCDYFFRKSMLKNCKKKVLKIKSQMSVDIKFSGKKAMHSDA